MKNYRFLKIAVCAVLLSLLAAGITALAASVPGGRYTVGTDIPAGDYTISIRKRSTNLTLWGSEYQNYSANGGMLLNVALYADKNPTLGKVTLRRGNVIDFSSTLEFEPYTGIEFSTRGKTKVPGGRYTIGVDIPAGDYSITIESRSTNLTLWGSEYQNYSANGGILQNTALYADRNPRIGKITLKAGNVIDFTSELVFEPYATIAFNMPVTTETPATTEEPVATPAPASPEADLSSMSAEALNDLIASAGRAIRKMQPVDDSNVLFDRDGLYVEIGPINYQPENDRIDLKLTIINDTDNDAVFHFSDVAVNGWAVQSWYNSCTVKPGTASANANIYLTSLCALSGISSFDEMKSIEVYGMAKINGKYHDTHYIFTYAPEDGLRMLSREYLN